MKSLEDKGLILQKTKLTCSTCTTACTFIIAALGLGPDDEVIIPVFYMDFNVNVIEHQGAIPVFGDID